MDRLRSILERRGDLSKVSQLSGINQTTISRIARGVTANPGMNTVAKIEAAVKQLDGQAATKKKANKNTEEKQTKTRKSVEAGAQ